MFEKRRIGSSEWERVTASEALEILHGITYRSIYLLRVCLALDYGSMEGGEPRRATSEDPTVIETIANNVLTPPKIPRVGYSVGGSSRD